MMERERQPLYSASGEEILDRSGRDLPAALAAAAAGLAAGFVATLAMDGFHSLWSRVEGAASDNGEGGGSGGGDEPSTVKLSRTIGRKVLHREVDDTAAKLGGQAVHYGYGAIMGGLYGLATALYPRAAAAAGAPYGALLFLLGDEVMVPALKLSKPPQQHPPSTHLRALGAHLVYGTTLELVCRGLRHSSGVEDDELEWEASTDLETGWPPAPGEASADRTLYGPDGEPEATF